MTDHTHTAPPSEPLAARPYAAPSLTPLGSVDGLTAGPDGGSIDQIFGGSGGFQDTDATS